MRSNLASFASALFVVAGLASPASAADLGIPVPSGAAVSCNGLALVCANGRTYPICPIAISVAGELVTGRLMTSAHSGTHIRLIPMGNGYRYAGRGVWFDGKYADAALHFGPSSGAIACNVETTLTTAGLVSAKN
jgi:hypothetical protein